uniref:Sulfotransferase 1A1-like n=1 Tax=Hirondellea gigas TaxID=1518452 RepID=A0A2P2I2D8_9CRUS
MATLKTGHQVVQQSPRNSELQRLFTGHPGALQLKPGGWVLPKPFQKYADDIADLQFEDDDVLLMTMPKSGTTWALEILWTMKHNPNFDNPMATEPLNVRSPVIEVDCVIDHIEERGTFKVMFEKEYPDFDMSYGMFLHVCKMATKPRILKSHLPFCLLSPTALQKGKVVYVIRDPRDVCISYYHHSRIFFYENFVGTFDQYVDTFIAGAMWHAPYWEHVKEAWDRRDDPNMHIMFYEKLKKNPKQELYKLDMFLDTNLTEGQIEKIVRYTSFTEMKKRNDHIVSGVDAPDFMDIPRMEKEGGFFRQGKAGGWRDVMTEEQQDKFQVWIDENCPDKEIMNSIMNP